MTAPKTPSGASPPGVAVIGTGYWGKNLVRVHHQLGALKLICDKDETVLARFQEQHPEVEICLAVNDVLDHALMAGKSARRIGRMCVCGEKVDEDLLAGIILKLGSLEIDGSLLNRYSEAAAEVKKTTFATV